MATNRYPGRCETCLSTVAVGEGNLRKDPFGGWVITCKTCPTMLDCEAAVEDYFHSQRSTECSRKGSKKVSR